jgi:hypothetical protein
LGYSNAYENTTKQSSVSKEDNVKKSISDHIVNVFSEQGAYKNFLFGELFILKPKEILELDNLIDEKNKLPLRTEELGKKYDSTIAAQDVKIAFKKQEIKDNRIYPWYEINHLFAIVPLKKEDSVSIFELDFEIYPNYTIKDIHKKMELKLSNDDYIVFRAFMQQIPLYESLDDDYDYQMNNAFYSKSLAAIESEEDYKGELIKTILDMMVYIRKNNKFDEDAFTLEKVILNESKFINPEYKIIDYGKLTPVLSQIESIDVVTGYEIIVKCKDEKNNSDFIYSFQFDLNFVLNSVFKEIIE